MSAYYNEHDPKMAAWLRELIKAGLIADGEVDERSVEDVRPDDLRGFVQCHFFAGIGGWSYALQLAGWPDDRPVWSGSCPCQPWSMAGEGKGTDDPRHLWPAWFRLIEVCRPAILFGEQVASRGGDYWIDLVYRDLEAQDYAIGAADISGACLGSPDIRPRLWFVAYTDSLVLPRQSYAGTEPLYGEVRSHHGRLADTDSQEWRPISERAHARTDGRRHAGRRGEIGRLDDAGSSERWPQTKGRGDEQQRPDTGWQETAGRQRFPGALSGVWADCEWVYCRPEPRYPDGCWRPVEPGSFPLAHGIPARMGRLRGYGNAIKPHVAAVFIQAAADAIDGLEHA